MSISAQELDQRDQELREAGARTPETETPAHSVRGSAVFDHRREHTGDYVETLKEQGINIAEHSVTGQRALVAPPTDLEGDCGHAFSALARVSR